MGTSKTERPGARGDATAPTRADTGPRHVAGAPTDPRADAAEPTATSGGDRVRGDRPAKEDLRPGTLIGRYVVLDKIATGGVGAVYGAFDPELDRKVAVKVVAVDHDDSDAAAIAAARLIREAKALAQLSHPNVVSVYDVGRYEGDVFIAMSLVQGETLRAWNGHRHSIAEIVEVFVGAGQGWRRPIAPGWSTATSSRTTCSSVTTAAFGSWTSALLARRRSPTQLRPRANACARRRRRRRPTSCSIRRSTALLPRPRSPKSAR